MKFLFNYILQLNGNNTIYVYYKTCSTKKSTILDIEIGKKKYFIQKL